MSVVQVAGDAAFYNQPDYFDQTVRDLFSNKPLPITYEWNTQSRLARIAEIALSVIIFPIGLYQLAHSLMGKVALLPASSPLLLGRYPPHEKLSALAQGGWVYKRLTISVDGYKIDAVIVGKPTTLSNGRWMIAANGNAEFYKDKLVGKEFKHVLSSVQANGIVFDYPGVGASSGLPNRHAMAKAYRAVLNFLEDDKKGMGAKEIIGYGHSIGAGVQHDALKDHTFKAGIKYAIVSSRSFSSLAKIAALLTHPICGFLVRVFGWNMDSVAASKKLPVSEIVLQTAKVSRYKTLKTGAEVEDDEIIVPKGSLAAALLDLPRFLRKKKKLIGIPEMHNDPLTEVAYLAKAINKYLSAPAPF